MKLYVLDCGQMWTERGFLYHFGTRADTGKEYQAEPFGIRNCQYFIDHPKAKIVFDLGFNLEYFADARRLPPPQGPRRALM